MFAFLMAFSVPEAIEIGLLVTILITILRRK